MTTSRPVLVALGSNLGSDQGSDADARSTPAETLRSALGQFAAAGLTLRDVSRVYRTPAFPPGSGPDFANAAALAEAPGLTPREILTALHGIEAAFGRQRQTRWAPRSLDLDLLAVGDAVLPDAAGFATWRDLPPDRQAQDAPPDLVLPHPRLQDRAFVLMPLMDVAPDWRHPVGGRSVAQMVTALPAADRAEVQPLE